MNFNKIIRYYYWVLIEFFKKNARLIIVSFLVSFIGIIAFLSVSPFIRIALTRDTVIGIVGSYDLNSLPDEILSKISNGLVMVTDKGEIIPVIANSWEVRSSGKEYRFHLKDNLLWNDGKHFSAYDINYQFKDVKTQVIDENTIDFYLNKELAIFPTYLNKPLIKYPLLGVAGYYKAGKIKTNHGYIQELSLLPNTKDLSTIIYKFYNNESQLVSAYKKGQITKMTLNKKSVVDTFTDWKNTKITRTVDYSKLLTLFINNKDKKLANKDIKDAIAMAIDYSKLGQSGEIARSPIPPTSWAYNPDLKTSSFNPETAKQIIGKEIDASTSANLNLVTYYDYYDIADNIVNELEGVGLKTDLNLASFDRPNSFDLFLAYLKIPTDPDQYYFWHSTQTQSNIASYNNVKIDKLLEDGRATINLDDREKIYFDMQRVMQDDPPAIFLYFPYVYTIERK